MRLLSGSSNKPLAEHIARLLNVPLIQVELKRFADGESYARIGENVRGRDLFIIQSTSPPINDHLMELLILIDAAKRASAARITAVLPYFGYARQDRKSASREPITAKLVADLISKAGADRVMTVDLHSGQIQGFFDIPVDNLMADKLFARALSEELKQNLVIVAPDVGATRRAGALAKDLKAELAIINKSRPKQNECVVLNVIGSVQNKNCLLFDDLADTCGTLVHAAHALKEKGANSVNGFVAHALLSKNAVQRIKDSSIQTLFTTDSIHQKSIGETTKLKVVSLADLLAKAIEYTHKNESVSSLFE
ncbi:ribose-phosphate pyrophosphokinase [Candidatus Micrarchaeota archaeon]|nr:ribose-phosphate pyrophosphokinase [Candidatus Micrarchaeota archaeon]MBU1930954.1 ribose-phosphate pyrophosphokinase [Candidatus Micrarchaeota archaeon]